MSQDSKLLPCPTCPWRVDQDASVIPGYDHALACRLTNTVGRGDAFRPIMACHYSDDRHEIACKGYLARTGWSNLSVRVLLAQDKIAHPDDVVAACEEHGIDLEPDYEAVLDKLAWSCDPEQVETRG
jgi:hypothetical protein